MLINSTISEQDYKEYLELNEYHKYCQEHGIDGDYLLASLITAKTFEFNKGGENV